MGESIFNQAHSLAKNLQEAVNDNVKPPSDIAPSPDEPIIYLSLVKGTRGYIEKVSHQINGCYAHAWYDACAVMLRRLLETLIIESFEHHKLQETIKDSNGHYLYLRDLIDRTLAEPSWTLGRNIRTALPKLKEIGDKSAHSRRYNAHRQDIDKLSKEIRDVVQELLSLANLK